LGGRVTRDAGRYSGLFNWEKLEAAMPEPSGDAEPAATGTVAAGS